MPFVASAKARVQQLPPQDPMRVTLSYLLQTAIGRRNAVPVDRVVDHINSSILGINISREKFQTTILNDTRAGDIFIGTSANGIYLIETRDDAIATKEFYESRIQSELARIANLKMQVVNQGWIPI